MDDEAKDEIGIFLIKITAICIVVGTCIWAYQKLS